VLACLRANHLAAETFSSSRADTPAGRSASRIGWSGRGCAGSVALMGHVADRGRRFAGIALALMSGTLGGVVAPAQASNFALVAQFGSSGSGDGQFNSPEGVALDSAGNIVVADTQNHRIEVLSPTGGYVTSWGGNGTGDGQFAVPQGLAYDALNNHVVVADTDNDRIQVFSTTGTFVRKFGGSGTANGQLARPEKVAVDPSGNVYVAERDNHRISVFAANGTFLRKFGSSGSGDGQFSGPHGIAVDAASNVYVADNDRIQVFDSAGGFLRKWGTPGTGDGQFSDPRGIAIDAGGNVLVNSGGDRVQQFSSVGTFLHRFPSSGRGVTADAAGNVYVAQSSDNRIAKFALGPEVTVKLAVVPAGDAGRFDLKVNSTTVAAGAASGGQGSVGVVSGTSPSVAVAAAAGSNLANYAASIDCGAGPQSGTSTTLLNVTADTVCTVTLRRRLTLTLSVRVAPLSDPGRFDLKVDGTTVKATAGSFGVGKATVAPGASVVVSEAGAAGTNTSDYDVTIDCGGGGGGQAGSSRTLPTVTADTTCTLTSTRRGAAPVHTVTFATTGAEQQFVVPTGVTSLVVAAVGARGGDSGTGYAGGRGARVAGTVPVTPGQTLFVEVGGNGATIGGSLAAAGGFNGGGSSTRGTGGGASDVRTVSRANADATASLDSRVVTAGGGGGAGGAAHAGSADGSGMPCSLSGTAAGGGAGTASQGGAGVNGPNDAGAYGVGGSGASFTTATSQKAGGGGGGGGWYGGGGGGEWYEAIAPLVIIGCGSGGGGGSSHVSPPASPLAAEPVGDGVPASVIIEYTTPPTVDPGQPNPGGTTTGTTTATTPSTTQPPSTPPVSDPFATLDASALVLSCEKTRIVLVDVIPAGRFVRVTGVATASAFNGRRLDVLLGGKKVGSAAVAAGAFDARVKAPKARDRKLARYQVRLGKDSSKAVKLDRRVLVDQIAVRGTQVVIQGHVTGPLAAKPAKVTFRRQTSCTAYEPAGSATPDRKGRFTVRVPLPPAPIRAAVYRGETRVAARAGGRPASPSATLARVINVR
jgi:DNA-binding beta-propeller fold protein YncE